MTGEKLIHILGDNMEDMAGANEAVRDILAHIEEERKGEVIIYDGITVEPDGCLNLNDVEYLPTSYVGQKGSVFFRPEVKP